MDYAKSGAMKMLEQQERIGPKIEGFATLGKKPTVMQEARFYYSGAYSKKDSGIGTAFRHDKASTVGTATIAKNIEKMLDEPLYNSMGVRVVLVDLIDVIFSALGITWEEEFFFDKASGEFILQRVVRGKIHPEHIPEPTDIIPVRKLIPKLEKIINNHFKEAAFLHPRKAARFKASPTFQEQAARAAQYKLLRDLMDKNKKRVVAKKIKTKPPIVKPRKGVAKKSKKTIPVYKPIMVKGTGSRQVEKGAEKGEGKQASTSQAADLARLKQYINRRLPAEVRRNMGRPGLQNRTGRFSNSVQLLSLTEAKNSLMAKYTYLLSPYETFENKGKKRWPMAYNPKPLIAKSIRNLAQGRIEQKLTVRRV